MCAKTSQSTAVLKKTAPFCPGSRWTGRLTTLLEWTGPFTEYPLSEYSAHIFPPMYAHSVGHIQPNFIHPIAFTPEQLHAISPHCETPQYIDSSELYQVLSRFWLLSRGFQCKCSFVPIHACRFSLLFTSFSAVARLLQWLCRCKTSFAAEALSH
jgi:hypothetical protein